jgi:hypothetical protein
MERKKFPSIQKYILSGKFMVQATFLMVSFINDKYNLLSFQQLNFIKLN